MKTIYILLFIVLISIQSFGAGNATDYLQKNSGARSLAMGSACVAIAEGADSILINPAGLALDIKGIAMASNYSKLYSEIERFNLYTSFPLLNGMLGINYSGAQISEIPFTQELDERPDVLYYFNNIKQGITLAYAFKLSANIGLGLNTKYYLHEMDSESAHGTGFDVGLKYESESWSLGLNYQNIGGTDIHWSTGHIDTIPSMYSLGISKTQDLFNRTLTIAIDSDLAVDRTALWHYGIEYWLADDLLALRSGSDQNRLTLGLGLKYHSLTLDYAYITHEHLGDSHKVSISFMFAENPKVEDVYDFVDPSELKADNFDKDDY